ncbi:MAG: phosphoribosylanthranilate isomerase [Acidobacteriota bacterium]
MMVKVCGITNRDDALAAAACGVSALGFNFYPKSPRYVAVEAAQELLAVVPRNVLKVGLFVNEAPACVAEVAARLSLDVVQLHGEWKRGQTPFLAEKGSVPFSVWLGVRVTAGFRIEDLDCVEAEAFLLDTPAADLYGGTGQTFDWSLARGARRPVILAGGLDETNVRKAIEAAEPWGVDACSRLESSPGRKDHRKMESFIKAALG